MNCAARSAGIRVNALGTHQQRLWRPCSTCKPSARITNTVIQASSAQPITSPLPSPVKMDNLAGFIERVQECNVGLEEVPTFTPICVDGKQVGLVKPRCVTWDCAGTAAQREQCTASTASTVRGRTRRGVARMHAKGGGSA